MSSKIVQNTNLIIPDEDGKILVVERFCKKSLAASGQDDPSHPSVEKWFDLPGGKVDEGDSHIATLKNEAEQELNINVEEVIHWSTMNNPSPNAALGSLRDIYIAVSYSGIAVNKAGYEEGHLNIHRLDPSEVPGKVGAKIDFETARLLSLSSAHFFKSLRHIGIKEDSLSPSLNGITLELP